MDTSRIIRSLSQNKNVYGELLSGIFNEEYLWKPHQDKWCLLEIVCHLFDEEQYDFRARIRSLLNDPAAVPPPIDPSGWVKSRKYIEQDYETVLKKFLNERDNSIEWLLSLEDPKWKNEYIHPQFGPMSAEFFLSNWLAHDYLHIRQIVRTRYQYLQQISGMSLQYAGEW